MPASSKPHRPRFPHPYSSPGPRNGDLSLDLNPSHASSSRIPSRFHISEQGTDTAATGNSHPSTPGRHQAPRSSVLDNFARHPSPGFRPKSVVPYNTTLTLNPHDFTTEHSTFLTFPSNQMDSFHASHSLVLPTTTYPLTTSSQYSLNFQNPIETFPKSQRRDQGMFHEAHDFTVTGTLIDAGNVHINTSNKFMEKLLKKTIPGAQFDSSDREPPPRCLPGTRLDILYRCLSFIRNCDGQRKICWVVGAAGVGKSAVMQSVAEFPEPPVGYHASVFFSINGRNDGSKAIITISYQFAVKSESYRQLIEKVITRNPSLLRASMAVQFLKLITEPFIYDSQLNSAGRIMIIIDGLDECKNVHTQLELLHLITDHCITYPSSPLVWFIACRPETHITSFFGDAQVEPTYVKEEIVVDSNEARADVEQFIRNELMKIKKQASESVDPQWPEERHVWKLAHASGGLFAYAATVIRYIGDLTIGSPSSQLVDVLNVIDNHPLTGISPEEHPMALLDALYAQILSKVPPRIMIKTRKFLLALTPNWISDPHMKMDFSLLCNWLGMTPNEAYAALNHLRSVLYVPQRNKLHLGQLGAFHKSFIDFIFDFTRSGFSRDIEHEAQQLKTECAFRILKEAPDGIDFGDVDYGVGTAGTVGYLAQGPGTGDNISVTWPVNKEVGWDDNIIRLYLYKLAIGEVIMGVQQRDQTFQSEFCIRLLATRFRSYRFNFPHFELRDCVFDEFRRHELSQYGIPKLVPLKNIDISRIIRYMKLRFRRPATTETNVSDPWNPSCKHWREGVWEEGKEQNWTTGFTPNNYTPFSCPACFQRLEHQWISCSTGSPDHTVSILFTSAGEHCVEFRFVDPEDGISEWTYWFWAELTAEESKMQGNRTTGIPRLQSGSEF